MSADITTDIDWKQPFTIFFDFTSGRASKKKSIQRRLSEMKGMFLDEMDYNIAVQAGDPLIYEFYDLGAPEHSGDLAFGTSIVYPGKVGSEYFMTKGHFHQILDTAEVYYCMGGHGYMRFTTAWEGMAIC